MISTVQRLASRLARAVPCSVAVVALVGGLGGAGSLQPAWAQEERSDALTDALSQAYQTNPSLAAARAELRTVDEQVPQALSNWRPRVTLQGDVGAQYVDNHGLTDPGQTTPRSVELDITQPLFRGGRTVAETRRAEAQVLSQRAALLDSEQDVLLRTVVAYADVWRDQSVLDLTQNNEQVLNRQLEASQDRFEVGEITRTDVAQSESRLARATGDRVAAEGNLSISRAVYEEVVGSAPGSLPAPNITEELPADLETIVVTAQQANPLVLATVFAEEAEGHNVKVQFGQLLPEVNLIGSLSTSAETSTAASETDRAQILASVTVPIYQQGFVSSQIREAKQRRSQRRLEIDEARRAAVQDSVSAWEALLTARAEIEAFESQVRAAEIALEGVRQENAVGARTVLDILDAEQEALNAKVNLVRARRDLAVASYQVLAAMGQMTAEKLDLPVEIYNPAAHLEEVRDKWYGFGDIPYGEDD